MKTDPQKYVKRYRAAKKARRKKENERIHRQRLEESLRLMK